MISENWPCGTRTAQSTACPWRCHTKGSRGSECVSQSKRYRRHRCTTWVHHDVPHGKRGLAAAPARTRSRHGETLRSGGKRLVQALAEAGRLASTPDGWRRKTQPRVHRRLFVNDVGSASRAATLHPARLAAYRTASRVQAARRPRGHPHKPFCPRPLGKNAMPSTEKYNKEPQSIVWGKSDYTSGDSAD